jgi:NAD+ synthetase
MAVRVIRGRSFDPSSSEALRINAPLVEDWLVKFLKDECIRRRKIAKAIVGLSGGVDSSVTAYLCAKAFGPENVWTLRLPYKLSSKESLDHAQKVIDLLGVQSRTIDITAMVDGYVSAAGEKIPPHRIGNICARCRMTILFDLSAQYGALPIGTGNKTERLFGYFTWHADDSPPINPVGDLFKTQVWQLAEFLGIPEEIRKKPPTADLVPGQTDEGDLGITYARADQILHFLTLGFSPKKLVDLGFAKDDVDLVWRKVDSTHWKRKPPTVAMLSESAIGEFYLRPVDY